ncbi:conserved hypothetical protein [Talaromyces stipitatus ATCC 10500]|uniref:HAT C-terminal dimerisation domain-containing protein n=1 Tax=Talaromyces stipitatus (strain ATCC 10500 / CBS 375.48 / QM 6759 / NRRL 1006) TaxID=441959 RepID=B8LV15_TALSN|nr:uncharacterized protein TSTA_061270 [Talaromyces stipitatus ATCC 10500]EED22636.1 conserved hypothetical protein [Talaromyces stipitatus ATCC 10500]
METSTYDPCLLHCRDPKQGFSIIGMQTDDTLIVADEAFAVQEEEQIKRADILCKPREQLITSKPLQFNGAVIIEDAQGITLTQERTYKNIQLVQDHPSDTVNSHSKIHKNTSPYKQYIAQRALGAYIASQADNPNRGLRFVKIDLWTAKLYAFIDTLFANNKDSSSQIGYIIVLANTQNNANILHWSSTKCKRITQSVLTSEMYGMANGFNAAAAIKSTLTQLLHLLEPLPLVLCTDLKSLYECLVKLGTTREKHLMIDLMCLRQSYERQEITEVRWINSNSNPADAMTKSKPCRALQELINTNKLRIDVNRWVERPLTKRNSELSFLTPVRTRYFYFILLIFPLPHQIVYHSLIFLLFHSFRELPVSEYQSHDSALLHPGAEASTYVRERDNVIPSARTATSYIATMTPRGPLLSLIKPTLANGGSDDEAGLEDQIESQAAEALDTLEYAASQTITSSQSSMLSYVRAQPLQSPQELLDQNIFNWAIGTMQPFSTFDDPLFRQIWSDLPGYSCKYGSLNSFSRRVDKEFAKARIQLKNKLRKIENCNAIALSLDGWKSANGYKIFAIIGHWITVDFQPRHRILDFQEIEGPDTGENLASIVYKVLCELDIRAKLLSITGNNASNNLAMAEILHDLLKADYKTGDTQQAIRYQEEGSFIRCLAHILNLIVKEFLTVLKATDITGDFQIIEDLENNLSLIQSQSAFSRIRILSLYISSTTERKREWQNLCQIKGMDSKLIQYDVTTRWNSSYRMLNDAWNAAPQIQEYLKMNYILPPFTDQDWNQLGQIWIVLADQSLAIYYQLFDLLQEVQDREGKFKDFDADIANAAKSAMTKYDKYYTLMNDLCDILYITMLLDPWFKKLVLEHELQDEAKDIITAMQEQLEIQYPIPYKLELPTASEEPGPSAALENPHKTIVLEMMSKIKAKSQKSAEKSSDIARYLNSDVVEFDDKKRDWIYTWWRGHIDEYPRMAAAARDYLAVPAAEVNVERVFNTGRDLLGLRRWSLSSGTMRKLLILKDSLGK